jgi:hypothetical protein
MTSRQYYNIAIRSTNIQTINEKSKVNIGQNDSQIISVGLIAKSEDILRIPSNQFEHLSDQINKLQELASYLDMDPLLILELS